MIVEHTNTEFAEAIKSWKPWQEEKEILARVPAHALIDSGCTKSCIDKNFVERNHIPTHELTTPYSIYNADGSNNEGGRVTKCVKIGMRMSDSLHQEQIELPITTLASSDIFLGYDWLAKHNPEIDWTDKQIDFTWCPETCYPKEKLRVTQERSYPAYLDPY